MKLTAKHFAQFQLYCKEWIGRFGLHDWEVTYLFEAPSIEDRVAEITYAWASRYAVIRLNPEWDDNWQVSKSNTDKELKVTAFHEVAELLLSNIVLIATARQFTPEELEAETHAVIHRLQHVLL